MRKCERYIHKDKGQYHSGFHHDKQITYLLWMTKYQSEKERQKPALFWIFHNNQIIYSLQTRVRGWKRWRTIQNSPMTVGLLTCYEIKCVGWKRQAKISIIPNSLMTIYLLQMKESKIKGTEKDQHHSKFSNVGQTTYQLQKKVEE